MIGTLSFEDIYGAGSLDTLPASESQETQQKVNPNSVENGNVKPGQGGIMQTLKSKNFLGQPIMVWFGLIAMLLVIKYFVEK